MSLLLHTPHCLFGAWSPGYNYNHLEYLGPVAILAARIYLSPASRAEERNGHRSAAATAQEEAMAWPMLDNQ